ncbi:hypothetical protein V1515DRAFT_585262 [Lipomyces mesembrius]
MVHTRAHVAKRQEKSIANTDWQLLAKQFDVTVPARKFGWSGVNWWSAWRFGLAPGEATTLTAAAMARFRSIPAEDADTRRNAATDAVAELLAELLFIPKEQISMQANLTLIGIDSLIASELRKQAYVLFLLSATFELENWSWLLSYHMILLLNSKLSSFFYAQTFLDPNAMTKVDLVSGSTIVLRHAMFAGQNPIRSEPRAGFNWNTQLCTMDAG